MKKDPLLALPFPMLIAVDGAITAKSSVEEVRQFLDCLKLYSVPCVFLMDSVDIKTLSLFPDSVPFTIVFTHGLHEIELQSVAYEMDIRKMREVWYLAEMAQAHRVAVHSGVSDIAIAPHGEAITICKGVCGSLTDVSRALREIAKR